MITVLLSSIIGSGLLAKFGAKKKPLDLFSLGFLCGFLIITLSLFLFIFLHIPLSGFIVLLVLGIETVLGIIFLIQKRSCFMYSLHKVNISSTGIGLLGLIILSILVNMARPIFQWDAITLYELRAHFFATGKLIQTAFGTQHIPDLTYYYGYPPLLSISHAITYILGFQDALMIYDAFYISLIIIFYYALIEERISSQIALLATLLLTASPILFEYSTSAYTNLPYTVFLSISLLSALSFIHKQNSFNFFITCITAFGSICIRQMEPFFLIPFILIIIHFFQTKNIKQVLLPIFIIIVLLVVRYGWEHYYQWDLRLLPINNKGNVLPFPSLNDVFIYLKEALKQYYLYFSLFGLSFILFAKYVIRLRYILFTIIIAFIMLIVGTFMLARQFAPWREIPDSVSRMMMFIIPLIIYYVAHIIEFNNNK